MGVWEQACKLFDQGELSARDMRSIAQDLYGDLPAALEDALSEITEAEHNQEHAQ